MAENTDLDKVWLVVSPQNPFKKSNTLLHEFDRLHMVELAIHDDYKLSACDIEFNLPKPSYTIDTLTYLSEKHPQHHFVLIMGEDNLQNFDKWKNYEQILEYYEVYVYNRPYANPGKFAGHPKVKFVEAPLMDISATYIRDCVKNNKSIKYLVHPDVENYIEGKKFYR